MALVIGDVAALRKELSWFDRRPLFGKRVLVTRARSQASRLAELLEAHGAEAVQAPAIRICPVTDTKELDTAIKNVGRYDWMTFTSPNGVRGLRERLAALSLDLPRAVRGANCHRRPGDGKGGGGDGDTPRPVAAGLRRQ